MSPFHDHEDSQLARESRKGIPKTLVAIMLWITPALIAPPGAAATLSESGDVRHAAASTHSRQFWRGIVENHDEPPPGQSPRELAGELSSLLGSDDPELRDEFAYSILTAWIYQKAILSDADLRPLISDWTANLQQSLGSATDRATVRRSFSALMLSVVVARDNEHPFLTEPEFRHLLGAAESYMLAERNLRGYDPKVGWIHSVAHTSDLLKFLARSRYLSPEDQKAILETFAKKLEQSPEVFVYGEDERCARALLSIIARHDFDPAAFQVWIQNLPPLRVEARRPTAQSLHVVQNTKNVLSKLDVLLHQQPDSTSVAAARASVDAALDDRF